MFGLGIQELIVVGIVAVVLFGKRLPEVARTVGSSYRDFRQGLSEIQSQMDMSSVYHSSKPTSTPSYVEEPVDYEEPTAPKFELPSTPPDGGDAKSEG